MPTTWLASPPWGQMTSPSTSTSGQPRFCRFPAWAWPFREDAGRNRTGPGPAAPPLTRGDLLPTSLAQAAGDGLLIAGSTSLPLPDVPEHGGDAHHLVDVAPWGADDVSIGVDLGPVALPTVTTWVRPGRRGGVIGADPPPPGTTLGGGALASALGLALGPGRRRGLGLRTRSLQPPSGPGDRASTAHLPTRRAGSRLPRT